MAEEEARRLAEREAQRAAEEEARRLAALEEQRLAEEEAGLPIEINLAAVSLAPLYHRDVQAKVLVFARQNFPRESIEESETGRVVLSIDVSPDGSVVRVNVLEKSVASEGLITAAVEAVKAAAPFDPYDESWIVAFSHIEISLNYGDGKVN